MCMCVCQSFYLFYFSSIYFVFVFNVVNFDTEGGVKDFVFVVEILFIVVIKKRASHNETKSFTIVIYTLVQ